jgi:dTDP-4-amino-4,6-dideoxygalactose transaminase
VTGAHRQRLRRDSATEGRQLADSGFRPCPVPFADLARLAPADEIVMAIQDLLADGRFVGGPVVTEFEREFASYCEVAHCVGTSSGTSALQAALLAVGAGPGDEVITVSATFVATAAAIVHTGATPVFVDIDPIRRTCDPDSVRAAITTRTRAIVPVDLYGHPTDLLPITRLAAEHGLAVVVDAAQAHGARYRGARVGSLADATCFSFYPSKNLGALGDAGAVTTNNPLLADQVRELRDHGRGARRDTHNRIGHNWRLDALQAAVLRVKLRHLDNWNALRRDAAERYQRELAGTELCVPATTADAEHVFHLYVVRHPNRDALRTALARYGVDARVHYPAPVHREPAFQRYRPRDRALPMAEALAAQCLSLPLFPGITEAEVDRVASVIRAVLPLAAARGSTRGRREPVTRPQRARKDRG